MLILAAASLHAYSVLRGVSIVDVEVDVCCAADVLGAVERWWRV